MKDLSESICAPLGWLDSRYFPDITLLDVTRDSELSQVEDLSSTDVTQDRTPVANLENNQSPSEFSEQSGTEPDRSYMVPREELSSTSTITGHVTHTTISFSEKSDKSVGGNRTQTSLEVTQDISSSSVFENRRPSLEPIGSNMVKIETSAEKTFGTHPANVTHDLSSSSDMSAQCAASQLSTSDGKCNTSLKNVTSELHVEPVLDCNSVEANDKSLTSHDAEVTTKETQPSPKTSGSVNGTSANGTSANGTSANGMFTSLQPSQSSSSTDLNATAEITSPQNKTLDLPPSDVNSCKAKSQVTVDATSVINNTSVRHVC
ncbi:Myotrophin [Dissostichus eleginoides]|uniref:Myotrophin n=1 Tax=Dissostichus eleginoides TaxID=100907 RepID=A0AAD9EU91_DISEL|nr:Myotrophin [Dissostichus eleginoides]